MAEGWGRKLLNANVYSAGTEPQGLNPYAVKVMAELGVDISTHSSKNVSELSDIDFDYVYTETFA